MVLGKAFLHKFITVNLTSYSSKVLLKPLITHDKYRSSADKRTEACVSVKSTLVTAGLASLLLKFQRYDFL